MLGGQAVCIIVLEIKVPDITRIRISVRSPIHAMATAPANMLHHNRSQRPAQTPTRVAVLLDEAIGGHLGPSVLAEMGQQLVGNCRAGENQPLTATCVLGHQVYTGHLREDAVASGGEEENDEKGRKAECDENDCAAGQVQACCRDVPPRQEQQAQNDGGGEE